MMTLVKRILVIFILLFPISKSFGEATLTHVQTVIFDDESNATGIVLAHAELSQEEKTYYTGLRYMDVYRREESRWRFSERLLKFVFFMPMEEWARNGMAQANRKRFPGEGQLPTDLPEKQPTWIAAQQA